jgi:ADP-heptose:LPS heptosyltransferase
MIINCTAKNFGGHLKMGDLVAVMNVFHYLREKFNNPAIRFYLPPENLQPGATHVIKFKKFLDKNTDFFSDISGHATLTEIFELWPFKARYEKLYLQNTAHQEKKICIFPLMNAEYNLQRNWPSELFINILNQYSTKEYTDYTKIICIESVSVLQGFNTQNFIISTDFDKNIEHVLSCSDYVGGDTGFSHFASVLHDRKNLTYYYYDGDHGTWPSVFTQPFHVKTGKGRLILFTK